jgi:N-acylneuraminate cytidylyltransferase
MKTIAIIPARGGSKSVPKKNIRMLSGKPLIAHTIEHAKASHYIDAVFVSTDDEEIATVSRNYGAEVIIRPEHLATDSAASESALEHALNYLKDTKEYEPDLVVFLQCTSPLMLPEDIDGTVQALLNENADSALAVTLFHYFLWQRDDKGDAVGINHDKRVRPLRQKQEPQFLETGAVYVMRTQGFKQAKHRFFGKTAMYVMPPERCLEIDEPVDFRIAEVLMREQQQWQKLQILPYPIAALVLDFDGVFTDNKVVVFQDGQEAVICDRSDGFGLAQLKRFGIPILVLSTEENLVVQARSDKLSIACMHGIQDKLAALSEWLRANRINISQVVYVGNDINDIACLQAVGCGVAVSDAHPQAQAVARIVLSTPGGKGAIREIAELIEQKREGKKDVRSS